MLLPVCVRVRRQTFEMREQLRRTTNVASRVRRLSINKSFEHKLCRRGTATVSKNLTAKKKEKSLLFFQIINAYLHTTPMSISIIKSNKSFFFPHLNSQRQKGGSREESHWPRLTVIAQCRAGRSW